MSPRTKLLAVLLPLVAVGACVRTPAPQPAPAPTPAPPPVEVPQPPVAEDWRDRPYSPGTWTYVADDRGSLARFGPAGTIPSFAVRCERATRQIRMMRSGGYPQGGSMRVQTSTGVHAWSTRTAGGAQPAAVAEMPARDAGLDAMAFSRGRWLLALPGATDLVVPSWPEFARVVEDCRA